MGLGWVAVVLLALLLMQTARTGTDAYVTLWSTGPARTSPHNPQNHTQASRPPYGAVHRASDWQSGSAEDPAAQRLRWPNVESVAAIRAHEVVANHRSNAHEERRAAFAPPPGQLVHDSALAAERTFLLTLAALTGVAVVATILRAFAFAFAGLRGAKHIHKQLLHRCAWNHAGFSACVLVPGARHPDQKQCTAA